MDEEQGCTWMVVQAIGLVLVDAEDDHWEWDCEPCERPCGAPVTYTDRGWSCEAGHGHDPSLEYFDDDELEAASRGLILLPANAATMAGVRIFGED